MVSVVSPAVPFCLSKVSKDSEGGFVEGHGVAEKPLDTIIP